MKKTYPGVFVLRIVALMRLVRLNLKIINARLTWEADLSRLRRRPSISAVGPAALLGIDGLLPLERRPPRGRHGINVFPIKT